MTAPRKYSSNYATKPLGKQPPQSAHESISDHVRAFEAAGGVIEKLGNTPALKHQQSPDPLRQPAAGSRKK